jgi:chorismate mutase
VARLSNDPVVRNHREQIADLDRGILEALNERIRLVRLLKAHKDARGLGFFDPAQEERVLAALGRANGGPLSEEGLREIFGLILVVAKREAARPEPG